MGENCRVLIYLFNCKFCQFGGVGQCHVIPPFTQPLPHLVHPPSTHSNMFLGTSLELFSIKNTLNGTNRNRDGTIVIKTNNLAKIPCPGIRNEKTGTYLLPSPTNKHASQLMSMSSQMFKWNGKVKLQSQQCLQI